MPHIRVGEIEIELPEDSERIADGQTAKKIKSDGSLERARLRGPKGELTIAYCSWDNGDRDVRCVNRGTSPEYFDRLKSGLRISLDKVPGEPEFRTMRLRLLYESDDESRRSRTKQTTAEAVLASLGLDPRAVLVELGAVRVDSRAAALSDEGRTRNELCAVFPTSSRVVPLAAYVLVRILPLIRARE